MTRRVKKVENLLSFFKKTFVFFFTALEFFCCCTVVHWVFFIFLVSYLSFFL